MIAATSLATGSASADIWGAYVVIENNSGTMVNPSSPLTSVALVNTPSASGVLPPKIKLYVGGDWPVIVYITSANYTRVVDFHRALQNAILAGGLILNIRTKPMTSPAVYESNLDSNIVTLLQYGY